MDINNYRICGESFTFLHNLPKEYNIITGKMLIPSSAENEGNKPFEVNAIVVSPCGIYLILLYLWEGKITDADKDQWYLDGLFPIKSPMNFCDACDYNVENLLYDKFHRSSGVTKTILYMPDIEDIDFQYARIATSKTELLEMLQEDEIRRYTYEESLNIFEFLINISVSKGILMGLKQGYEKSVSKKPKQEQSRYNVLTINDPKLYEKVAMQKQAPTSQKQVNQSQSKQQQAKKQQKKKTKKANQNKSNQKKKNANKNTQNKANKNTAQAKNQAKSSPKTTTRTNASNVQNNTSEKLYIGLKKPETNGPNGNYDVAQVKNQTKSNNNESEKKTASDFIVFLILLALLAGFIGYILWDFNKKYYGEGYVYQNNIINELQYPTM